MSQVPGASPSSGVKRTELQRAHSEVPGRRPRLRTDGLVDHLPAHACSTRRPVDAMRESLLTAC